jgi:mevalonate kinase
MSGETQTFKSHGKFLITAEYLILKGAVGLALPLKRGQTLTIKENDSDFINWESTVFGKAWFRCKIDIRNFKVVETTDKEISNTLMSIFDVLMTINAEFLMTGVDAIIDADFNLSWGLGSSSTLINNISQWAFSDPYYLLEETFGGSGYDIACAGAKGPLTYQLNSTGRTIKEVNFNPSFANHIFFVYLGKKMNSRTGMSYFKEKAKYGDQEIEKVNAITEEMIRCSSIKEFEHRLREHENLLSTILQMPTIKESNFPDYPYTIKSMGAWGGDFVLVTGHHFEEVKAYFNSKGLDTVIPYHDIVLS